MSNNNFDVIIVGAGCSGLSAAQCLCDLKIKVLEKNDYLGGRVESRKFGRFNIETGALFPILEESDKINNATHGKKNVKYIKENGQELEAQTITEILQIEDQNNALKDYTNRSIVLNDKLGLRIKNSNYGNVHILSEQQQEIAKAVYQITHCGEIKNCQKNIAPLTLTNITKPVLKRSNKWRLEDKFKTILNKVTLNSNVLKIKSTETGCRVTCINNGEKIVYESKYVLVSCPPAEVFGCIEGINCESADFYSTLKYEPGSVCALRIHGDLPDQYLLVNTHKIWSACFISIAEQNEYIIHVYIPHSRRLVGNYRSLTLNDVYESVQCNLPNGSKVRDGVIKHWDYLSPSLNQEVLRKYFSDHYKLTPRIWYCGELAGFSPKNCYAFGTRSAMNSGHSVAQALKQEIEENRRIKFTGLFDSEIYKITEQQPIYIRSRVDGNVAYYGIIASAYKENSVIDYLYNYQKDNQWEYHEDYGTTLEDSLLVVEGLIDAVGVSNTKEFFNIDKYISNYQIIENGLFTTIKYGCSDYWGGPTIIGNAHILYITEKLNITDNRINKRLIVDYLLSKRRTNGLWESKWFTNRFYTSFYVIRALQSMIGFGQFINSAEMISILEQSMKIYSCSENSLISMIYIIRTLVLLIKNTKKSSNINTAYTKLIKDCTKMIKGLKGGISQYSSESLLFYWQDIETDKNKKIFITSKPKIKLIKAMIDLTENELIQINI